MKNYYIFGAAVFFFPLMVAVNSWLFKNYLDISYVDWYIENGALISIAAAFFGVVWKNLNDNVGLISSNPAIFLAANLKLIGSNFRVIGAILHEAGASAEKYEIALKENPQSVELGSLLSELFDAVASLVSTLLMGLALSVWFFAIVPFQYFVVLVAGASARLSIRHELRIRNHKDESGNSEQDTTRFSEWIDNFLSAPVSFTNAVAALIILVIKLTYGAE